LHSYYCYQETSLETNYCHGASVGPSSKGCLLLHTLWQHTKVLRHSALKQRMSSTWHSTSGTLSWTRRWSEVQGIIPQGGAPGQPWQYSWHGGGTGTGRHWHLCHLFGRDGPSQGVPPWEKSSSGSTPRCSHLQSPSMTTCCRNRSACT
jgi:hypothetical protein